MHRANETTYAWCQQNNLRLAYPRVLRGGALRATTYLYSYWGASERIHDTLPDRFIPLIA